MKASTILNLILGAVLAMYVVMSPLQFTMIAGIFALIFTLLVMLVAKTAHKDKRCKKEKIGANNRHKEEPGGGK